MKLKLILDTDRKLKYYALIRDGLIVPASEWLNEIDKLAGDKLI